MVNIFIILSVVSLSSSLIKKLALFCSAVNLQGALQTQIRAFQGSTLRKMRQTQDEALEGCSGK